MAIRFFCWFQLAALVCLACMAGARMLGMYRRGVRVIVTDWKRKPGEMLGNQMALFYLMVWCYEMVAYAWPLRFHVAPWPSGIVIFESTFLAALGAVLWLLGIVLYKAALNALGDSWRLGIDYDKPGKLVTGGVFAWSRNPIYVSINSFVVGAFLMQGRLIFLVVAVLLAVMIHVGILREERFLSQLYGEQYTDYCKRTGRYCGAWR
jgi:protein-S-isoprenylcysteine O-methyltransferase Ste14